jgi:hypothetical protein
MNGSKRHANAVVFERGVLEAERDEQFALDELSHGLCITPGRIADHPRQQHKIAVRVAPLSAGFCAQARIGREGRLVGHVELHLRVNIEDGSKSRLQRLTAADATHHTQELVGGDGPARVSRR